MQKSDSTLKMIFFDELMNKMSCSVEERARITQQFLKLPTIANKVDFVLDILSTYDMNSIIPNYIKDNKNNNMSLYLRDEGNKLFSSQKYEEALEMYTYCIALAEDKSENLGLAYANRSAVLFKFGFFEECLKDIERVRENYYPDALKFKIIEREKKALTLKKNQQKLQYYQPIPSIDDRNPLIECASNCVEIKNDSEQGRCIVATRDIEIGEIIAVERPTFSILKNEKWCHCHHCLKLCYNLLPCNSCTKALFCSSECKDSSILYHKYECQILATLESFCKNSGLFLPMRIAISMRGRFKNCRTQLKEFDVYKSESYKEIHNLVTNEMHRSPGDLFERAVLATIFYKILKDNTDFFEGGKDFKDIFVELLFRHMQTMDCNFHEIDELFLDSNGKYDTVPIGVGAYNFMSLFNHSCAANVNRTYYGTIISMSTIETIKKGEQLFDNYGFYYANDLKSKRQAALKKQYHFVCHCRACEHNWGTANELKKIDEHFFLIFPLMNYFEDIAKANVHVAKKILPTVMEKMKKMEKSIPCIEFQIAQDLLSDCLEIFGNLRRSLL